MRTFLSFLAMVFCITVAQAQGVGIGTTTPDTTAELDIASKKKGLLIPRLNENEKTAITTPATGLLVYNTTIGNFQYFNGLNWITIVGSGETYWSKNGNDIFNNTTGNVGIGTSNPTARLTVDSSIMVDQSNSNQGFLAGSALYFGSDKKVGIVRSFLAGSSGRNGLGFFTNNTRRITIDSTGQVGIGTINPLQTLHVNGSMYLGGYMGIGNFTPEYAFDNRFGFNYMKFGLGIGTLPGAPYLLDVGATTNGARFQGDVLVQGTLNPATPLVVGNNAAVGGTMTVNNGKGVAYNGNSSTNLRIYTFTTGTFNAVLPGYGLSAESAIAFNGGFTSTPRVFVGDISVTGGASGELYRVQLQLYGCSTAGNTTTCKARLLNTSPNPVNYSISWNCMAMGN